MGVFLQNIENQTIAINQKAVDRLKQEIEGSIITPSNSSYDQERKVWNAMIDRHLGMIIQCATKNDILKAVKFAHQHKLLISIRGAGHNIAGRALQSSALLIDLSQLRMVKVDSVEKTATIYPGATLADIDQETAKFGLALPVGINSTTGISGLTLGGGFGWLSRSHGMTIDHLISAEIVTTKGELIVCDKDNHSRLFWALRGGGGNFALVCAFKFSLVDMPEKVLCGPVIYKMEDAKEVLKKYRKFIESAPDNLTVWTILRNAPPFPFLNPTHHGKPILAIIGFYNGPIEEGKPYLSKLETLGETLGSGISPHLFTDFQKAFDPLLTPGARNYWKTHNFKELNEPLIDTVVNYGLKLPSSGSEIFFAHMGGATNKVGASETAYPHRDVEFIMNVHTRWEDDTQDDICIGWARELYQDTVPYSTGGAYSNFVSDGDDSIESAYGQNAKKLQEIKTKYDPENVLRTILNVAPKKE